MNTSGEPAEASRHVVAVDVVCLTVRQHQLKTLLVRRASAPFIGEFALPGATVRELETLDAAAHRIVDERAWLPRGYVEQLYTFDGIADPRGPRMSVAYFMLLPDSPLFDSPLLDRVWWSVEKLPPLPFDHALIIHYARHRLQSKLLYTPIAFKLLPEAFTLTDLRVVHEAIDSQRYPHATNFQTQMLRRWSIAKTGDLSHRSQKPAHLYRYVGPHDIGGPPALERTHHGT